MHFSLFQYLLRVKSTLLEECDDVIRYVSKFNLKFRRRKFSNFGLGYFSYENKIIKEYDINVLLMLPFFPGGKRVAGKENSVKICIL